MGLLRASVIIYTDLQLLGYLLGHAVVCYIDLLEGVQRGRPYPLLYDSGVRYVREPPRSEVWQAPFHAMGTKAADCEDLSCWRSAELWAAGETAARPMVRRISPRLRHILVRRADGSVEDPSLILGMHKRRDPHGWEAEADAARAAVLAPIPTPHVSLPWEMPAITDAAKVA
jgi:hypothetical protein